MGTTSKTETHYGAGDNYSVMVKWTGLTCGDDGEAFELYPWVKSAVVQAVGTFNSQTVTVKGSNDNTNYSTLNDQFGSALSFDGTGTGLSTISEASRYIKPSFSGSSGGDIDVYLYLRL